jgi:GNAT superfamily N-acetyltransferase
VIRVRALRGERREMAELQRVLQGAPGYCNRVMGAPAGPAEAQSTYSVLPEGKTFDDKFLFGIYAGDEMVGCADVIRDWPRPGTSIIGLLLIAEAHQGRGHGRAAYDELEKIIQGWGAKRVRAAVVRNNSQVIPFWERIGFKATGEVKPYRYGAVVSEAIIFEKAIASP